MKILSQSTVSDRLTKDFDIIKELGKGSNNKVFRIRWNGKTRVLRAPRRCSDTQQTGNREWEYAHTQRASDREIAPLLVDSWYARHADNNWPSGLYLVLENFPYDLSNVLDDSDLRGLLSERWQETSSGIVNLLERLAEDKMLLFDLKPCNIVLDLENNAHVKVRMIDFGRDFCEWKSVDKCLDENTPTIDYIIRTLEHEGRYSDALLKHILFAVMLVQLSATTCRRLYMDRHNHRLGKEDRADFNLFSLPTSEFLDSMQGQNIKLLRKILRTDPIRGVLRHYHGRRNAGTRRTLRFAREQI